MHPGDVRRVVIVDDDPWVRRGRSEWLSEVPSCQVVASLSPPEALAFDRWHECDVAIVDAWDEGQDFDRFPGVAVVERIRAARGPDLLIIVISGHVFDDMLRLRMAEAGADFFYGHNDVRDVETLVEAISRPEETRRVTPGNPERLAQLGLSAVSRPNATLRAIEDEGMKTAFAPGLSQKQTTLSRRAVINARKRLAAVAKLSSDAASGRSRESSVPEWRAVVRFVNRARGAEPPPDQGPTNT